MKVKTVGELKKILDAYADDLPLEYYDDERGGGFGLGVVSETDVPGHSEVLVFLNADGEFG